MRAWPSLSLPWLPLHVFPSPWGLFRWENPHQAQTSTQTGAGRPVISSQQSWHHVRAVTRSLLSHFPVTGCHCTGAKPRRLWDQRAPFSRTACSSCELLWACWMCWRSSSSLGTACSTPKSALGPALSWPLLWSLLAESGPSQRCFSSIRPCGREGL